LKRIFNILFGVIITLSVVTQTSAQSLPTACVGTVEKYWVRGFNGVSDFTWQITDSDGNIVPPTAYSLIGRGDTIEISWTNNLKGGIYTFTVLETTDYGCSGVPYEQDVVLNSPEIFIPFNTLPGTHEVCIGSTISLDPGSGYLDYLWQDESTNQLYITGEAGTYRVRLVDTDQNCSYDTTNLTVNPLPIVFLGNDTVLLGNQTLLLDAFSTDLDFYDWSTGAISSSITVDGQSGDQEIWVLVTDNKGCENSDTINIKAGEYNNLKFPAAFTPNGDNKNDTWKFPYLEEDGVRTDVSDYLTDVTIRVYNRYGSLVWESTGEPKEWDGRDFGGRELPMDSYHYVARVTSNSKTHVFKGSVTIVK